MIHACSVATKSSFTEFMLLKRSIELFHDVSWTVSCDPYASNELSKFSNVRVLDLIESDDGCSHGTNDKEKTQKFTKLAMTKFDAVEDSINRNGYGLFFDSDIIFTNPIDESVISLLNDTRIDAILCPHMTNNLGLEAKVGHYNTGLFSLRSKDMLKIHVNLSSNPNNGFYTDQQAIQFAAYEYKVLNLPINYNIGWWRFNESHTMGRINHLNLNDNKIKFGNLDAVCFHVHTLKKLDYKNYGQFLLDKILNLMDNSKNSKYHEIAKIMRGNNC